MVKDSGTLKSVKVDGKLGEQNAVVETLLRQ